MITNPEKIKDIKTFKCRSKLIMNYLIYDKHLSLFSMKDGLYQFVDNDETRLALKKCPVWLKLLVSSEGLN